MATQHVALRTGDTLPAFAAIIETDDADPIPLNLTGATVYLRLRPIDGRGWDSTLAPYVTPDGWYEQQIVVQDAATGAITHAWATSETALFAPVIHELAVRVQTAAGSFIVPTDEQCELRVGDER